MNEPVASPHPAQHVVLVVPTLGRSPWLTECVSSIERSAARWVNEAESAGRRSWSLVLVAQGPQARRAVDQPVTRVSDASAHRAGQKRREGAAGGSAATPPLRETLELVELAEPVGFAAACNHGMRRARELLVAQAVPVASSYVAFVNDDAVIAEAWLACLVATLRSDARLAAVQGLNHDGSGKRIDGLGLRFNSWYQAVQIEHGAAVRAYGGFDALAAWDPDAAADSSAAFDVLGVSATAALWRLAALDEVGAAGAMPFDESLESFYEDVDLALRLRLAGWAARTTVGARAKHLGSATTAKQPRKKAALLYGNRLRVLWRYRQLIGAAGSWAALRSLRLVLRALLRDLLDLARPPAGIPRAGILAGWRRFLTFLPGHSKGAAGGNGAALPCWPLAILPPKAHQLPTEQPAAAGQEPVALLSTVVVHWHNEDELRQLLAAWRAQGLSADARFPLCVVDNGSREDLAADCAAANAQLVTPEGNLGFGGGVNRGVQASRRCATPWVLVLNPDCVPEPGALEQLLAATEQLRDASLAGLAPCLQFADGRSQTAWQLRPLPRRRDLLAQAFFLPGQLGPQQEPPAGATVEQPAAAALALRRDAFELLGGFDEGFLPAWYEDVDFALRAQRAGLTFRYCPAARFVHQQGASVGELGYGHFLRAYTDNLVRFSRRHHGGWFAAVVGAAVRVAALARLAALPLRRPRRAASRRDAARALYGLLVRRWRTGGAP